jgi:hypothetical protein
MSINAPIKMARADKEGTAAAGTAFSESISEYVFSLIASDSGLTLSGIGRNS